MAFSAITASAAAGDWISGTTAADLLKSDSVEETSTAGVPRSPSFLYGERVIRKSRRLADRYDYVQHLVKRANESLPEEVAPDAYVLFEKQLKEREFCFTDGCIADWLQTVADDWEEIVDAIDADRGEEVLSHKMSRPILVTNITADRAQNSQSTFIQACKGAPSGLACAVMGITPALGIRGHGNQVTWKADALYEKACYLGPGSSCLTLGDWYFLNGQEKKAKDAYLKASTMGEDLGAERLQIMKDNPVGLIAWIQSHPTPSQSDWYRRCNAPYGNNDKSAECLKSLQPSQNKRLINVLNEIGIEQAGIDLIERAVDKLATTVGNMAAKERSASGTPRYRGGWTTFRVKSKMIERLSLLSNGDAGADILTELFYDRCRDQKCGTLAELRLYLKEQYEDFRQVIRRFYGEDTQQAAIVLDALNWIKNSNDELAARLTRELRFKYDTTVLEALVLSDMLEYQEATRRVF